jgi:hypothetical protein
MRKKPNFVGELAGSEVFSLTAERLMDKLYHGTLAQNLPSIREQGLLPKNGPLTASYHGNDAANLVFAIEENRKGLLVKIMIQQIIKAGLVSVSDVYHFDDFKRDFITHGALVIVNKNLFNCYGFTDDPHEHPVGVERGDRYSRDPVRIEGEMVGQEMLDWLHIIETNFDDDYRRFFTQTKS